jgi:hypothetical protein
MSLTGRCIFAPIAQRTHFIRAALIVAGTFAIGAVIAIPALSSGDGSSTVFPAKERGASAARAEVAGRVPVVEVVFDGLPTATLMNRSGTRINAKRFPGFARLAANSTWYRNNTTVADFTGRAVPAIETGINPGYRTLPIASEHPNSIFTLLADDYKFNVHEPVTQVCPRSLCPHSGPSIDAEGLTAGEFAQHSFAKPKPREFKRFLKGIPSRGRSFNFIHFEVPHEPFHFLPNGRSYNYTPISDVANHNAQRWAGGVGGTATTWQRHYIQTGYADTLTRRLIRRLKQQGIWNRALVIVTADHGFSFDPKEYRRLAVPGNFGGIANPILFIKYPGQTEGAVFDIHTRTIDIVPTTAEVLGIEPYKTEGIPISAGGFDGSVAILNGFRRVATEPLSEMIAERERVLRRARRQLGGRTGLFKLGPSSELLGKRAPGSGSVGRLDSRFDFGNIRRAGKVPVFVNGTIGGGRAGRVIAIAVNGRIVATCRAFRFKGRTRWGAVVPPASLHSGRNSVGAYMVRGNRLVRLGDG